MAVEEINEYEFNLYNPQRDPLAIVAVREEAWFRDSDKQLLGTVIFDRTDRGWGYVVLGADARRDFRAIGMGTAPTKEEASVKLREEMESRLQNGDIGA